MSSIVFSGARAVFSIGGQQFAFASGVSGNEEVMMEPVDVLDRLETVEYVPVGYRVSLQAEAFRTIPFGSTPKPPSTPVPHAFPIIPENHKFTTGSLKGRGIFPKVANILTEGVMTATISDRASGLTILTVEQVRATSMNFRVTARGIVGQDVSFNAIRFTDESESAVV